MTPKSDHLSLGDPNVKSRKDIEYPGWVDVVMYGRYLFLFIASINLSAAWYGSAAAAFLIFLLLAGLLRWFFVLKILSKLKLFLGMLMTVSIQAMVAMGTDL